MGKIVPFRQEEDHLDPDVCPCMTGCTTWMIFDEDGAAVYGINGESGTIALNHPSAGLLFVHAEYCPYCGRKFNHEEVRDGED